MNRSVNLLALDVGEKRIGVAKADSLVRLATPFATIEVDGHELDIIRKLLVDEQSSKLIIGYPRNQSGEVTNQTKYVEDFVDRLGDIDGVDIAFQDESLTSVQAEQRLVSHKKPYKKADVDAMAASIILQDYLEINYAK